MKISKKNLSFFKEIPSLYLQINKRLPYLILLISITFYNCSNSEDVKSELRTATINSTTFSNVLAKSVTLSAYITDDGNSNIIERGFVWSMENNPTINDNIVLDPGVNIGTYIATILNLKANTEYFAKAYVKNNVGIYYGNEVSFKTNHHIYDGSIDLKTQDEIDSFGDDGYTIINGNLVIGPSSDITSLDKLTDLTLIEGKLEIFLVNNLETLQGLENITSVRYLYVYDTGVRNLDGLIGLTSILGETYMSTIITNINLTNVDGLTNVTTIGGGLSILNNDNLLNIDGLSNLSSYLKNLVIELNPLLTNLDSLININSLDNLNISSNQSLTNLNGLNNIVSINKDFNIRHNPSITNLNELNSLEMVNQLFIDNNDGLLSIDGLQNLNSIGFRCEIRDNDALDNYCAFSTSLFSDNDFEFNTLFNAYNPTKDDILNGNCNN